MMPALPVQAWSTGPSPASAVAAGAACPGLDPAAPLPASTVERSIATVASCTSTPIDEAPAVLASADVIAKPSTRTSVAAPVTRRGIASAAAVHAVRPSAS